MQLNIQLPSQLKELEYEQREAIIKALQMELNVVPVPPKSKNTEHNIWLKNDEDLLGDAEEELYKRLISPAMNAMAELIAALGLSNESIEKSLSNEFLQYEDTLIKSKSSSAHKISDLMGLSKKKRQAFLKYLESAGDWGKKKLKEIDKILSQKLPDYAKIAEEFAIRAAFIAKIRNQADTEALEMTGAYVDRFPKTTVAASKEGIVVSQRIKDSVIPKTPVKPPEDIKPNEKAQGFVATVVTEEELEEARKNWKRLKVLPLQPQELKIVENAEIRATEKIQEVSNRHRAGIKQIVLQAVNGRWSAQQLAQALYDAFGEQNRDWRRVAITELAMASTDAYLAGLSEGESVWVAPVEGACKHCQKLLENRTFTVTSNPKLMGHNHEQEMRYVWVGKTNFGRTVATWIPCIPLHPHCRHRFIKISRFYNTDGIGKPTLKPVHQLIQEERLKRGLGLDPNLPPI